MEYETRDFSDLLHLDGFSQDLMKTHVGLYEGYVDNTNRLLRTMRDLRREDEATTPQYAELRRRFGWEFNGMRLHEIFFGNLTRRSEALDDDAVLRQKLDEDFGGYTPWKREFTAIGGMRGIGWVCLYYDPAKDVLHNIWIDEHDTGQLAGCQPILLLDVFEHAFITDFGTDRDAYMEAFFSSIDWVEAERRLQAARTAGVPVAAAASMDG